jgi:phenylalanyl-tRNA synthetase beta chain
MKLSPQWLREFVDVPVDNRRLAEDLTNAGVAVENISGEGDQMVFDTEITPNRPDAMNHYGVAREASAIYNVPLKAINPKLPKAKPAAAFPIEVQEPELCPRFTARAIHSVSIKPSPPNVANRLALLDSRPINNAVDASNYTLMEMGKPTHAFDLDLLQGGKISVRRALEGETLKTLDGIERRLSTDDLVVADARRPVALAGVMGGFDTMITEQTRNILIESAWWDPATIRKTSKRHGLHTDASHRFERGADFESTILSCNRVAELIFNSGGGELSGEVVDVVPRHLDQAPIALHISEVRRILGESLGTEEIFRILEKLGFMVVSERNDGAELTVQVPSWRLDVEREIDLIEELARIHGYDKFPNTLPVFVGSVLELPEAKKDRKLRSALLGLGYDEAVSLSFISHEDASKFSGASAIELANPLSEEASVMRTTMVPGMLNMLAYNLNRGTDNVRLFEAGNVFEASDASSVELKHICLGVTGNALLPNVHLPPRQVSFFDLKGDMENLLATFECHSICYDSKAAAYYHPGRCARAVVDGETVAQFGQVHPDIAAERKLRQPVFIAEIYLDLLYQHQLREGHYEPLPRYPGVERDFSFIFPDSISFERIQQAVSALGIRDLRSFVPIEIFRGGTIPAAKYSILLRATFQSRERTLREDEVAAWSVEIVRALGTLGGEQRT